MNADRPAGRPGPAVVALAVLGVCCGLPALLSVGVGGVIAGIGVGSWLLIAVCLAVVAGLVVRGRRRSSCAPARTR
jgi:hypothetical protein